MNKNIPNIITLSRVILTPIMILLFLLPINYGLGYFVAFAIYVIGSLTDAIDGYLARKYKLVSNLGKVLDQIADKFIQTSAIVLILLTQNIMPIWASTIILLLIVLRDIWISAVRQVCLTNGVVIPADFLGKLKSIFIDIATAILMFFVAIRVVVGREIVNYILICGISILLVGVGLSVISCVNYTIKAIPQILGKENKEKSE